MQTELKDILEKTILSFAHIWFGKIAGIPNNISEFQFIDILSKNN